MASKESIWPKIIGITLFILFAYGIYLSRKENREAKIMSAVEAVCEYHSLNLNCLTLGAEVVNYYNKLDVDDSRGD